MFEPVIGAIQANNVCVSYTGMSHRTSGPIHIVVLSGYAYDYDGTLWLHIDDPATANAGHRRRMGEENIHVLQRGEWEKTGAKYWLRAGRLLEYNLNTPNDPNDLWGDYSGGAGPGIASWITTDPTPDSSYAHDLGTSAASRLGSVNASLPLDLGGGLAPTASAVEAAYAHVERGPHGGWYPVSENTLWHGGVHMEVGEATRATVHVCLPGTVVAARLGTGEAAEGPFGSRNFVLVRHEMPEEPSDESEADVPAVRPPAAVSGVVTPPQRLGPAQSFGPVRAPSAVPLADAEETPEREGDVYYSLYMHLAALDASGEGAGREQAGAPMRVTTTVVNYRRAPRKDPDPARDEAIVIDGAPEGTRFEPLPDAPQARLNTANFQWGRVHLEDGVTEAYMTTNEQYLKTEEAAPLQASAVSWLQTPELFEVVTERNYRRVPRTEGNVRIGLALAKTQFEILPNPPEPEVGNFRWGRVLLPTGPVEAFMSVVSPAVKLVRPREPDEDLLRRLAGGDVVAVERPVRAGEVLWEAGPYGPRPLPGSLPEGHEPAPRPTVLHWEVFSADNLLADLCRDPAPLGAPASGDGQAGAPPQPRYPAPQTETRLRVRRVEGPATAEVGREVTFRVADFSASATPAQRSQVNWELRVDNRAIGRFMTAGDRLAYTPLPAHAGRTLSAHPFMRSPADNVAARTRVVAPPPWWTAEDPDADFQVDAGRVLDLFEGLDATILGKDLLAERMTVVVEARREGGPARQRPSFDPDTAGDPAGHLAYDELASFYAGDPGGRATRLRHAVCRFESEWGIGDVRAAIDELGVGAPEATAAAVERHQWWAEAVAAGADLPPAPRLWHYHPLSFLVHVAEIAPEEPPVSAPSESVQSASRQAADLIAGHERFMPDLYHDPSGFCTVGYGHLLQRGPCTAANRRAFPDALTHEEGLDLLMQDIAVAEAAIRRQVTVPLNQNQFDGLTSFVFNIGEGNLAKSTLLRRLNAGDYDAVPSEMNRWNKSAGRVLGGLVRRRQDEGNLFSR